MLKNLKKSNPKADFLISDFSFLHESVIKSESTIEINRPIISTKKESPHEKEGYKTIFDPKIGTADIFFQTDFNLLKFLTKEIFKKEVKIISF